MNNINKSILYIAYFFIVIIVGSIGFYYIGDDNWTVIDSIYMTIITLFFVGFSEVHPLSEFGRLWTILIIFLGVAGIGMLFSSMRDIIIYFNKYRRILMMNKIKNFSDHFIICGYGRMGAVIADELDKSGFKFIIIEKNDNKVEVIREKGMLCIHGDATLDQILQSASVSKARGIAVALNNDQDNLFVTMSIRTLNHEAFLLSRCSNDQNKSKLIRSGANKVINPYITGGFRMAEILTRPEIEDSFSVDGYNNQYFNLNIDEISIRKIPAFIGKSIAETKIKTKYHIVVVCIINPSKNSIINPNSDYVFSEFDRIMLIGDKDNLDDFASNETS